MVFWLPLYRSRYLQGLRWLQCICAALALWHVEWPAFVQLSILLLIFLLACRQPVLPRAIFFDSQGLRLVYVDRDVPAKLGAQCYSTEYWILLEVLPHDGSSRRSRPLRILLLPDASSVDALRSLRIYLRWHAQSIDPSIG